MLTKGAIGNLVNRYRAVLRKCNLINTFGSLAVASMLVLGGASVACAKDYATGDSHLADNGSLSYDNVDAKVLFRAKTTSSSTSDSTLTLGGAGKSVKIDASTYTESSNAIHAYAYNGTTGNIYKATINISGDELRVINKNKPNNKTGYGIVAAGTACQDGTRAGGQITVDSTKLYVEADTALWASSSGKIIINSKDIEIIGDSSALQTRGMATVRINANEDGSVLHEDATIKVNGDIYFDGYYGEPDALLTLNLTGENSALNGDIITTVTENNSTSDTTLDGTTEKIILGLYDGAVWKSTNNSFVNVLNLKNGVIDITENEGTILVTHRIEGEGSVLADVNNTTGKIVAGEQADTSKAALVVTALQNADEVTEEQAKALLDRVEGVANTTAEVAEGDVMGAMTIDKDGNLTTAKNTLMDAALQQASVTMVSLDKILTNDVRKRLGDIRSDANTTGVWMRWDGGKMKGDSGLTNNFNTIQIGGDTKAAKNCRIGFAGSFTHGDTEFARGTGELEGFSFALYGTWMAENGMFADVVARLGKFSTEMSVEGRTGDIDNRVASLSAEYGWRLPVCGQFFVEPQIELAYTYVSSDDLQLGKTQYEFDNVDSLTGRVGAVFGWNLPDDRGNVYARASVLQQFMGDAKISGAVDGGPNQIQEIDGEDTWLEYGIGANVKLTDNTYVWADVERTEGADIEEEWRGTVGVRFSF